MQGEVRNSLSSCLLPLWLWRWEDGREDFGVEVRGAGTMATMWCGRDGRRAAAGFARLLC